jgi:hypothetical protein
MLPVFLLKNEKRRKLNRHDGSFVENLSVGQDRVRGDAKLAAAEHRRLN